MIAQAALGSQKSSVEDTRHRILMAAREVYALKGSHGTTTREVAERAGVNEATLFRHFGTKQSLLYAMREYFCSVAAFMDVAANLPGELEADLKTLGLAIVEGISRNRDLIGISMAEDGLDPEGTTMAWRGPTEVQKVLIAFMRAHVDAGRLHGDPEDLARFFMAMFFAHVMARKLWLRPQFPSERIVAICTGLFLNGARAR